MRLEVSPKQSFLSEPLLNIAAKFKTYIAIFLKYLDFGTVDDLHTTDKLSFQVLVQPRVRLVIPPISLRL